MEIYKQNCYTRNGIKICTTENYRQIDEKN